MSRTTLVLMLTLWLASCNAVQLSADASSVATPPNPTATAAAQFTAHSPQPVAQPSATTPTAPTATQPVPSATPLQPPTAVPPTATATPEAVLATRYSYPIGQPGRVPGDGFFMRHGYATENTWFSPGNWHTGEDWYSSEGDTAGAQVYAIAAGDVMYVGANYPGRVVIVRHAPDLFSMYGHLDPAVAVQEGQSVERGTLLGVVLQRGDAVPNHLHFEVRSFFTTPEVNGNTPRYGFRCGVQCPPGPGYWPIAAPDHPGAQGWRNPTHVVAQRMFSADAAGNRGEVVVPTQPFHTSTTLWSAPPDAPQEPLGELVLEPGARFALLDVWSGPEDQRTTSAQAYAVWYRIATDSGAGWVQAAIPSPFDTGNDGRPSSVEFDLLPVPQ